MPYRALTHGRVSKGKKGYTRLDTPTITHSQATAINSSKGVSNSGSVISQRNKNNQSNKQPRRSYARTLSSNLLLAPDAFGQPNKYISGQGKGFPNAPPQTSVGSTNTFSRRAIARRAVTSIKPSNVNACCKTLKSS